MELNRLKQRFIALILSCTMPLSGCASKKNDRNEIKFNAKDIEYINYAQNNSVFEYVIKNIKSFEEKDYEVIMEALNKVVLFVNDLENSEDIEKTIEDLYNSIDATSLSNEEYKELMQEMINAFLELRVTTKKEEPKDAKECPNELSANFNLFDICETIKYNSLKYIENNNGYEMLFPNTSLEGSLAGAIADILKGSNNVAEDLCLLESLVIVGSKTEDKTLAKYDSENNVLFIDMVNVNNYYDSLMYPMKYLINHIRKYPCKHRKGKAGFVDNVITMAAPVSKVIYNKNYEFVQPFTDYQVRKYESYLFLLALFNESVNLDDYYKAVFDGDKELLYEFYDLKSREEREEFEKTLYIMDTLCLPTELRNLVLGKKEVNNFDYEYIIGYDYLNTLFKLVIRRMVDYTCSHPDFSLEENLEMFNIVKSLILSDAYSYIEVDGEIYNLYDEDFVSNFDKLESIYVDFLSRYYKIDKVSIKLYQTKLEDRLYDFWDYTKLPDSEDDKNIEDNALMQKFKLLKSILYINRVTEYEIKDYNDKDMSLNRALTNN